MLLMLTWVYISVVCQTVFRRPQELFEMQFK